jgi:hypothetical protein
MLPAKHQEVHQLADGGDAVLVLGEPIAQQTMMLRLRSTCSWTASISSCGGPVASSTCSQVIVRRAGS